MIARRCRIALLGFGHVGSAVARRLAPPEAVPRLELTHIFDRHASLKRRAHPEWPSVVWTPWFPDILASDTDIVVEAIGGSASVAWIEAALLAGKSVVTANKQAIALHGLRLLRTASRQGRQLRFEAAVGGAIPIVRAIGEGLAGDHLTGITAILNGTTNAVLSTMESTRCTLSQALDEARCRGYAEADASADLDGEDAGAKLAILCGLAFGLAVDPQVIEKRTSAAIRLQDVDAAARTGGTIRQIARAEYDHATRVLAATVAPAVVPRASIFGRATGPANVARISGRHSGETELFGVGSGGDATAVAIISDIVAIARDLAAVVPPPAWTRDFTCSNLDLLEAV